MKPQTTIRRRLRASLPAAALAVLTAVGLYGCGAFEEEDSIADGEVTVEAVKREIEIRVPAKGELESLSASPIAVPRVPTGALILGKA